MSSISINAIDESELVLIDERVKELKARNRSDYVRGLIRGDLRRMELARPTTFHDILDPIHKEVAASGMSEAELDTLLNETRNRIRSEQAFHVKTS